MTAGTIPAARPPGRGRGGTVGRRALPAALFVAMAAALLRPVRAQEVYTPRPHPPTDGLIGTNYTPAYAVNQVQFWHDFRPEVVDRELAAARKWFGISTLRVFLHDINFFQERPVLMANLERFLRIADRHGIRPGFVFFDGCHRADGIYLDRPTAPVPGFHNGRWAQSPQARDLDPNHLEKFKPYVQEIVRAHRTDRRVLFWEIHNEPPPGNAVRDRLKRLGFRWAKEVRPVQPVLNCEKGRLGWGDCEVSDIVDAHLYAKSRGLLDALASANPQKGTVFTEAGARWKATLRNFGDPCAFVHWLQERRRLGKSAPGMYLCWELMVGNTNTRWHWRDKPGAPEPEIPWCGLLWPDGTPVSLAEAEAVRRYTTGRSRAMLFSDFEAGAPGWTLPGGGTPRTARGALVLPAGARAVAGETAWADYVLEGLVAVRPDAGAPEGRAGLLLRVTAPAEGRDAARGYAVTFDGRTLRLDRLEGGAARVLASYDLGRLRCRVRPAEWNMIRVAAVGPRIRVWFDRLHPSADPERGLRIDYTDREGAIPAGAVGAVAEGAPAWFDNVVVLPPEALP